MKLELTVCEGYALLKANVIFIIRSAQIEICICRGVGYVNGKCIQIQQPVMDSILRPLTGPTPPSADTVGEIK